MKFPKHIELSIRHNPFAGDYQTAAAWLEKATEYEGLEIAPEDRAAILETGEVWEIVWYPDTPVGSCSVAAATLERALELAGGSVDPVAAEMMQRNHALRRELRAAIPVLESARAKVCNEFLGPNPGALVVNLVDLDQQLREAVRAFGGGGPEGIERAEGHLVELRQLLE